MLEIMFITLSAVVVYVGLVVVDMLISKKSKEVVAENPFDMSLDNVTESQVLIEDMQKNIRDLQGLMEVSKEEVIKMRALTYELQLSYLHTNNCIEEIEMEYISGLDKTVESQGIA